MVLAWAAGLRPSWKSNTRCFLYLYTCTWPFCNRLTAVDQRDAGKRFRDKLLQWVFRIVAWFRLRGTTVNPTVSPTCSKQGELRSGCSGLCLAEFWLSTKMRILQPLWETCSSLWLYPGEEINVWSEFPLLQLVPLHIFVVFLRLFVCLSKPHKNYALLWYHLRAVLCLLYCFLKESVVLGQW